MSKGKRNVKFNPKVTSGLNFLIKGLFMVKTKRDKFISKVMLLAVFLLISARCASGPSRQADRKQAGGEIQTKWRYPVRVTIAFPTAQGYQTATAVVPPRGKRFRVVRR